MTNDPVLTEAPWTKATPPCGTAVVTVSGWDAGEELVSPSKASTVY